MEKKLFQEFKNSSGEEWEKLAKEEIGTDDLQKKIYWNTEEGFTLKPIYTNDDLENNSISSIIENYQTDSSWKIKLDLNSNDLAKNIQNSNDALSNGVDEIGIIFQNPLNQNFYGQILGTDFQLKSFFEPLLERKIPIHLYSEELTPFLFIESLQNSLHIENGSLGFDPFRIFLLKGSIEETTLSIAEHLVQNYTTENFQPITLFSSTFKSFGVSIVEELSYTVASFSEYIQLFLNKGLDLEKIHQSIRVVFATGPNYFFEIAKLRSAKILFSKVLEVYGLENINLNFHSEISKSNISFYEPYNNLLRFTTEASSAIIGGSRSITIPAFDDSIQEADSFSNRLSKNIQLILKNEAYLDKVSDPASGSYYVESLTSKFVEKSWEMFQEIEYRGGFLENIKNNSIQKKLNSKKNEKQEKLHSKKEIFLGINEFPKFEKIEKKPSFLKKSEVTNIPLNISSIKDFLNNPIIFTSNSILSFSNDQTIQIDSLKEERISTHLESLRFRIEKSLEQQPKTISLLSFGDKKISKLRSSFIENFLIGCGFKIHMEKHTTDLSILKELVQSKDIVVFCSSDPEYVDVIQDLSLPKSTSFFVAGYPKDSIDLLQSCGIIDFIHKDSNSLEIAKKIASLLKLI